jgi:hypothetical protein
MEASPSGCVVSIPLEARGEAFAFVSLPDSLLIIEDQVGEESLDSVATVVERRVEAPYRARGFRLDASRWIVIADPIDVIDLGAFQGEELTLTAVGGDHRLVVDGFALAAPQIPADLLAEAQDAEPCVISATKVDEQWWELTIEELPRQIGSEAGATPSDAAAQ